MKHEHRKEINLYKEYASGDHFKSGLHEVLMQMMEQMLQSGEFRPSAM